MALQAHQGRIDLGSRIKGACRDAIRDAGRGVELDAKRQKAHGPWARDDALGYLTL